MDRRECREEVKENIEYQELAKRYGHEDVDEILDLITDTLCSTRPTIRIGGEEIPIEAVKDRFWRLEQSHIEYVFDRMKENTTKIRNIRGYRVNPKFCVKSISGANRAKFICCGSRLVRLPPCQQHNAGGGGCQGRRSRSFYP